MSEHENMISRSDLGGSEDRGSGLGDETNLEKAELDGLRELQEARDEINERGFVSADDEQAERLLEEDRAGSLPDPREPEHEAERKAELSEQHERLKDEAAQADLSPDDPADDSNSE
jgi:hypothetical protein